MTNTTCPTCGGPAIHNQSDEGTQSIESVVRWIQVTEDPATHPPTNTPVLVCGRLRRGKRVVAISVYSEISGPWEQPANSAGPMTHWMPLPDPPPTENKWWSSRLQKIKFGSARSIAVSAQRSVWVARMIASLFGFPRIGSACNTTATR